MPISVYINQQPTGTLAVSRDGLYTILEVCVPAADGLVRLWAHGDGKTAYLGVMQPRDGRLVLRRRFTRRELMAFPDPIEFVSDRETENLHNEVDINEETPAETAEPDTGKGRETTCTACPWPAEVPGDGLLWYRRPDGSFVSFHGISSLLAIPAELRTTDGHMTERMIEGKKYLVFRT